MFNKAHWLEESCHHALVRYFTRGWATGELDDMEWNRLSEAYARRLDAIEPHLPEAARRLARDVGLHAAIIDTARFRPVARELILTLVIGDLQSGYRTLVLAYQGVLLGDRSLDTLREVARDRETEVLYDEVDLVEQDETLVHRLLFEPRDELTIYFRALQLEVTPRPDRKVDVGRAFFVEKPEDDE